MDGEFLSRCDWGRILMEGSVAGVSNLSVVRDVLDGSDIVFPGMGSESVVDLALRVLVALGVRVDGVPVSEA